MLKMHIKYIIYNTTIYRMTLFLCPLHKVQSSNYFQVLWRFYIRVKFIIILLVVTQKYNFSNKIYNIKLPLKYVYGPIMLHNSIIIDIIRRVTRKLQSPAVFSVQALHKKFNGHKSSFAALYNPRKVTNADYINCFIFIPLLAIFYH